MALTAEDYVNLVDESITGTGKGIKDPSNTGGLFGFSPTATKVIGAGLGALFGGLGASGAETQGSQGYTKGIPEYQFTRQQIPYAQLENTSRSPIPGTDPAVYPARRPGEYGRSYFTGTPDLATDPTGQTMKPMYIPKGEGGEQTFMGQEELAAMEAAARQRQQDYLDTIKAVFAGLGSLTQQPKQQTGGTSGTATSPITRVSTADQNYTGDEKQALYDAVVRGELSLQDIASVTGAPYERVLEEYNRLAAAADPGTGDINDYISWASGQWVNPESLITGKQPQYYSPSQINPEETVINKVEAGNILRAAMEQGISPAELAESISPVMPITEQGVVDWIKANYPNEAKDYLAEYGYAKGGLASLGKGYYLGGRTDGMADKVPARINNQQPAALSDGEFVIPADVVSHLGNGNSNAGADVLYSMMDRIRKDRTGRSTQGRQINPNKYIPKVR
jgi:hypothetical protein